MSNKISRRKMFGFAATAPFAVGAVANNNPAIASTKKMENAPDENVMVLQAQKLKKVGGNDPYTITMMSYENTGPQLGISVGKDGHMWLKINNEWKKVIVE